LGDTTPISIILIIYEADSIMLPAAELSRDKCHGTFKIYVECVGFPDLGRVSDQLMLENSGGKRRLGGGITEAAAEVASTA
jgi:hypothetical protein